MWARHLLRSADVDRRGHCEIDLVPHSDGGRPWTLTGSTSTAGDRSPDVQSVQTTNVMDWPGALRTMDRKGVQGTANRDEP